MLRARSLFLPICALILATVGSAGAQEFRATVKGQVADTSDAALPGATVTVQNQDTNEIATAVTNTEGAYTLPFLRPGLYTLTVEMSGFQKNIRKDMRLEVGQVATVNVQLGVGLTETVNVSSEAPLLETSRADRGQVIDSARIAELPLQSRSPMALAVLVAGVNYNAQAIYLRPFDNGALADWSMNGGQNRNNEFLLDGVPNNANQDGNNIAYVPPAEAVQEFKVATNSYDAQYGRTAGGVVNMSLKSGTNAFHGVGYEFYRRKWLDSNSFLLNARNAPKTDHYLDQYGGILDGPIIKNKTFFMFTGEQYREGTPAPLFSTVPTDAMKPGDFSGLVDAQGRQIVDLRPRDRPRRQRRLDARPVPGQPHPGGPHQPRGARDHAVLPVAERRHCRRRAVAAEPALRRALQQGPVLELGRQGRSQLQPERPHLLPLGRERAQRSAQHHAPIRSGPAQDGQLPLIRANRAIVGDWVHVFGGGTVFNVRGGYTYYLDWSQSDASFGFDSTEFGWPQSLVSQFPSQGLGGMFPRIEMADFVTLSRGTVPNRHRNYSIQPNISLTRGQHNIRSGLDVRWTNAYQDNYANAGGLLSIQPAVHPQHHQQHQRARRQLVRVVPARRAQQRRSAGQRLHPLPVVLHRPVDPGRLARQRQAHRQPWLSLGWQRRRPRRGEPAELRVRSDAQPESVGGVPVIGGVRFVGVDGAPETPWKYDKNNFQLRAGMAYSINEKTVLRGGYGKYYLNPTARSFSNGFNLATPVIASNDDNRTPTYALGNPWPNGIQEPPGQLTWAADVPGTQPGFSNPDFVVPNVHQFSVGVQRELPWGVALEVSYAGSRTNEMQSAWNGFNEPSAEFQRQCDLTLGGSRSLLRPAAAQPVLPGARVRGHDAVHQPDALALRAGAAVPGVHGCAPGSASCSRATASNMTERNDGSMNYDSVQFVANKRLTKGITSTRPTPTSRAGTRRAPTPQRQARRSSTPCR